LDKLLIFPFFVFYKKDGFGILAVYPLFKWFIISAEDYKREKQEIPVSSP